MNEFLKQYIETALWSSTDESTDDGGMPLDDSYSVNDLAPETLATMTADCAKFEGDNALVMLEFDHTDCAHDFWLTRNGHGAGFWDGDYPEVQANMLTNAAEAFGEFHLYVGDDGKIYGDAS